MPSEVRDIDGDTSTSRLPRSDNEMKPRNAAAEKELSQLFQAQSALDSAKSLFDSGDFTKALEFIDNLEALLLRGRAYYYLADHDVAIRHYQKGLYLDPESEDKKSVDMGELTRSSKIFTL